MTQAQMNFLNQDNPTYPDAEIDDIRAVIQDETLWAFALIYRAQKIVYRYSFSISGPLMKNFVMKENVIPLNLTREYRPVYRHWKSQGSPLESLDIKHALSILWRYTDSIYKASGVWLDYIRRSENTDAVPTDEQVSKALDCIITAYPHLYYARRVYTHWQLEGLQVAIERIQHCIIKKTGFQMMLSERDMDILLEDDLPEATRIVKNQVILLRKVAQFIQSNERIDMSEESLREVIINTDISEMARDIIKSHARLIHAELLMTGVTEQCPICYCDNEMYRFQTCSHEACLECIKKLSRDSQTCHMCRKPFIQPSQYTQKYYIHFALAY